MPQLDSDSFMTGVRMLIDGQEVGNETVTIGDFVISDPNEVAPGKHHVEVIFDRYQRLPDDDLRPVGAKFCAIGFAPASVVMPSGCV